MITRIALILSMTVTASALTRADEPKDKQATAATVDVSTAKQQALDWLGKYEKVQVLFHQKDIDRVRKELTDGSAEDALAWWKKTADIRAALDSAEWKDTQAWFREFLKVQAIFSDEEVDKFRNEAEAEVRKQTPEDFKKILADVENYRRNLAQGSANARDLREQKLKVVDAFRKEEAAARAIATAQAAATVPQNPIQPPVQRRPPRSMPGPLINSLDAARWSVMGGFWRY